VAGRVKWTTPALLDLQETAEFIARDSRYYAAALVREAMIAARTLRQFARRGRVVPEFRDDAIRELFVQGHRMIYRIAADQSVQIIAFIHGTRDLSALWQQRPN
jgi:toxin ParE1/3/4